MTLELCALIAEKTGYAASELDPDFELEADLGIDTVKQAEIFGELRERHGLERDESFKLADYPTIRGLAGWLAQAVSGRSPTPPEPPPAAAPIPTNLVSPPAAPRPSAPAPGPTPAPNPAAMDDSQDFSSVLADLLALVAEKTGYAVAELDPSFELEADLGIDTVKQAEIFGELRERYGLERDESFKLADYPTLLALATWLHTQRGAGAPPTSARAPWASVPLPAGFFLRRPTLAPAPARPGNRVNGRSILVAGEGPLAEAVRAELARRGASLDGAPQIVIDLQGDVRASFALARRLADRRPSAWIAVTRLGGFSATAAQPADALVQGAVAGFTKALGREWADTHARVLDVHPDDAVADVATGLVDELEVGGHATEIFRHGRARRTVTYQNHPAPPPGALPDGAVVLVTGGGRGVTARCAEEVARRSAVTLIIAGRGAPGEAPLDVESAKAKVRAALQASGERVTPAEIERRVAPLKRAEEVRQTLASLRATGAEVRYVQLDTADEAAVALVVQDTLAEFGRLDLVIHGAGVEESRLLADKDDTAFARVYDGKANGGRSFARSLPSDTFLVTMGSVAGRFGNAGQVDYAAANDGLARLALARPRTLHLDWTAWDDVGMAVRGGMKRLLTDRGVELLPADAGASVLVDLVAAGVEGELVVAGALGDFLPPPDHPLLDRAELGDGVVATRRLSLASDPWIADHAIAEVPVLPGVIGLELMAACAMLAAPGAAFAGARDVNFSQPAKLHRGEPLDLKIEAHQELERLIASVSSTRTLRTGRPQLTPHFSAEILLGGGDAIAGLPDALLPDEHLDQAAIYARFFHGPRFQVLTDVQGVAADALLAEGLVDPTTIAVGLHTEPLLLEAAFQAAGLHHMLTAGEMALPSHIDEVRLLAGAAPGERLTLLVRRRADVYDVDVDGAAGPLLRLRGFRMAVLGPLEPERRFPEPPWERPAVFDDPTPTVSPNGAIASANADEDPHLWLGPDELAGLKARGTERRIRDRIAGRIAAKKALFQLTGVDPLAIRVPSAPSGEPLAEVPGYPGVRVSITHREGRAVAWASPGERVGVDLELIEPRPQSFADTWLTDQERARLAGPHASTVAWATKEAVQKVLGAGMALSPSEIEVLGWDSSGRVSVGLRGDAAARHRELGGGALEIQWSQVTPGEVLVQARLVA